MAFATGCRAVAVASAALAVITLGSARAGSSESHRSINTLIIQFQDAQQIRSKGGRLVSLAGADLWALKRLLSTQGRAEIVPLFAGGEEAIEQSRRRAEARSGRRLLDLNSYFEVTLDAPITAVLGEIVGGDNGYGVTGIANQVDIGLVTHWPDGMSYSVARSIECAAGPMGPGDVLLVEAQTAGPRGLFVPPEWDQAEFDAISVAAAAGIVTAASQLRPSGIIPGRLFNAHRSDARSLRGRPAGRRRPSPNVPIPLS
jgi:hypothetical protein